MRKYKVTYCQDLPEEIKDAEGIPDDCTDNCLIKIENGNIEVLGFDGGEPEDQLFSRDWSWVLPALQEAYNAGKKDALEGILT